MLESYCRRQLRWDPKSEARVVTASSAVGVFTCPPMGVLAFAAVPTSEPVSEEDAVDLLVPLDRLADLVASSGTAGFDVASLPRVPNVPSPMPNLHELPPREGWLPPFTGVAGDQAAAVDVASKEFEARAPGLPPRAQEEVAEEIWSRPGFGGLPMRALHAARQLGMLASDSTRIASSTNGPWKRLSTSRGQVFVYATGPAARLSLHVVR